MAAGVSIRADYVSGITCLCLLISGIGGFKDVTYEVEKMGDEFGELDFGFHGEGRSLHRLRRQVVVPSNESSTIPASENLSTVALTKAPLPNSTSTTYTTTTTSPTTITTKLNPSSSSTKNSTSTTAAPKSSSLFPPLKNETAVQEELNHTYYDSQTIRGPQADGYWVDLNHVSYQKKTHGTLSNSHRTAATVELRFKFIFYGHEVAKVTIATGGFLYMSDFLHQWLTATQYIAPLMANFDTQLGNASQIHYADNGTAFIVQWENVHLQDNPDYGHFNFQAILLNSGEVIFVYKEVPVSVSLITSAAHPVKVGLSDAYYYDTQISTDVRRRTIYEYHRVNISFSKVASDTVIIIKPRTTCVQLNSCEQCAGAKIGFECKWCPAVRRCSDGLDRKRQEWQKRGCTSRAIDQPQMCNSTEASQLSTVSSDLQVTTVQPVLLRSVYSHTFNIQTSGSVTSTKPRTSTLTVPEEILPSTVSQDLKTTRFLATSTSKSLIQSTLPTFTKSPPKQNLSSTGLFLEILKTTLPHVTLSSVSPSTIGSKDSTTKNDTGKDCMNFVGDSTMCASAERWRSGPGTSHFPSLLTSTSSEFEGSMSGLGEAQNGKRRAAVKPVAIIIPVVIILVVLLGVFWFIYAYRNPQSQSGMWLIEHRPSNLKAKLNNVRFWKRNGTGGEKYEVSMQPEGESVA